MTREFLRGGFGCKAGLTTFHQFFSVVIFALHLFLLPLFVPSCSAQDIPSVVPAKEGAVVNLPTEHGQLLGFYHKGVYYAPVQDSVAQSIKSTHSEVNQDDQTKVANNLDAHPRSKEGYSTRYSLPSNSAYFRIGMGYNYGVLKDAGASIGESMGVAEFGIGWNHYARNGFFYSLGFSVDVVFGEKLALSGYGVETIGAGVLIDIKNKLGYYWELPSVTNYIYGLIGPAGFFDASIFAPVIKRFMGGGIMFGIGFGANLNSAPVGFFIEFAVPVMFSYIETIGTIPTISPYGYIPYMPVIYKDDVVLIVPRIVAGVQIGC